MPLRRKQINRLAGPAGGIRAEDMPHRLMRAAEAAAKQHLIRLESLAAATSYDRYKTLARQLAAAGNDLADQMGVTDLDGGKAAYRWLHGMNGVINQHVADLKHQVEPLVTEAVGRGAALGYYLRGWELTVSSTAPVTVAPLSQTDLAGLMLRRREGLTDVELLGLLGDDFLAAYQPEWIKLIATLRASLNQSMSDGLGIDAAMRRLRDKLVMSPDSYKSSFGTVQALTRTYIMAASNAGAARAYERNSDIIESMEHLTADDERVCAICRALAGTYYPLGSFDIPPRNTHPLCRCTVIPVLRGDALSDDQAASMPSFKDWMLAIGLALLYAQLMKDLMA